MDQIWNELADWVEVEKSVMERLDYGVACGYRRISTCIAAQGIL